MLSRFIPKPITFTRYTALGLIPARVPCQARRLFSMAAQVDLPELENAAVPLPDISKITPTLDVKTPKRKAAALARSQMTSTIESGDEGEDKNAGSDLTPLNSEVEEEEKPKKKTRKPRARKPTPEYVIPDVEKKTTTFKGRLGYACLNTILRVKKPDPIFCSRTLRIATIKEKGVEYMKDLGKQNMKDLCQLIEWNEANNIRFMRMSSEMFPFASHPEYGYDLEYAAEELKAAGDLAKKYGHRLTTHPGQFTQLGSPRDQVVANAVRDLTYHCEMIDRMGLDKDSVMIIHGGGVFQDKAATLQRIRENYSKLPENVKGRVVLENDEICYNVDDLLPICEELNIPMVFDYHHDWIFPSSKPVSELMPRILATWEKKGIKPKQHLSEPRPGAVTIMERRAHSDRCKTLPADLPDDMDLMLEAKDKEQAVLEMYRMYDLYPTIHRSLRPPADVETLATKGRKSNKKKKAAAEDEEGLENPEVDEDGNPITPAPKKRKRATPKAKKEEAEIDEEMEEIPDKPKRKAPAKKRTPAKKAKEEEDALTGDADMAEPEDVKPKKTPRKMPAKKTPAKKTLKAKVEEVLPEHIEDAAAKLTGLPPMPEGFTGIDGQVHAPEAAVEEEPVQKKAKIEE